MTAISNAQLPTGPPCAPTAARTKKKQNHHE
jgi:hypothetical protein